MTWNVVCADGSVCLATDDDEDYAWCVASYFDHHFPPLYPRLPCGPHTVAEEPEPREAS